MPFALGSETWGSIVSPAANCGVTGLRPTLGRVSRHGAMALSWSLDKVGPLGLTADDCGLVLEAIAGPDPLDPSAADRPFRYEAEDPPGRRFRFGVLRAAAEVADAEVRQRFEEALEALRAIGTVEDVTLPALPYEAITRTILFAEAASALEGLVEDGALAELTAPEDRYTLYARDAILAKDYIKALRLRAVVAREIDRILAGLDALVAPGRFTVATRSTSRSGAPSAARSWIRRERSETPPGSRRSPSPTGSASAGCRRASSSWGARGERTRSSPRPGPTRRAPTGTGVARSSADPPLKPLRTRAGTARSPLARRGRRREAREA